LLENNADVEGNELERLRTTRAERTGRERVRADDVVGWIGRLLGQPLDLDSAPLKTPGFVAFSGSGSVLVDLG